MVSGINNLNKTSNYSIMSLSSGPNINEPLHSFEIEDQAIISSQAKLLNELEKFNSGEGNIVDLAVSGIMAESQTSAIVNVINSKKDMLDKVMEIGE